MMFQEKKQQNDGKTEIKLLSTTLSAEKSNSNDAATMVKVKSCQKMPHTCMGR